MIVLLNGKRFDYTEQEIDAGKLTLTPKAPADKEKLKDMNGKSFAARFAGSALIEMVCGETYLTIIGQAPTDFSKLEKLLPIDQSKVFKVSIVADAVIFEQASTAADRQPNDPLAKLMRMNDQQLQVEAARAGVDWDTAASRDTMIERIAEALSVPAGEK